MKLIFSERVAILLFTVILNSHVVGQDGSINIEEFKAHMKFLSDDRLQGRFPGSAGGDIASLYIASQFERSGLRPFSESTGFFQDVSLELVKVDYPSVRFVLTVKGIEEILRPSDEVLLVSRGNTDLVEASGDLIFAGYGVVAPEYGWDDYKDTDVRGKIVVCFNSQPNFSSPNHIPGNLTYYFHPEYKAGVAFGKGAIGLLLVNEKQSLFSWDVWKEILSRPDVPDLGFKAPLKLISYTTQEVFERLLIKAGMHLDDLTEQTVKNDFRPMELPIKLNVSFSQSSETLSSPNVIGVIPGKDNPDEAIVFVAHYDHLGIGRPVNGDSIYNGAIDNASGTAALISLATYFSRNPQKRSIVFIASTAEELGLLGVYHYLNNPAFRPEKTIIGFNMDMMSFFGKRDSVDLSPVPYSDAEVIIKDLVGRTGVAVRNHLIDRQLINFRTESFLFAMFDILMPRIQLSGNLLSISKKEYQEIMKSGGLGYHMPIDSIRPWFRYEGVMQELEILRTLGLHYANDGIKPNFNAKNPYAPAKLLWCKP